MKRSQILLVVALLATSSPAWFTIVVAQEARFSEGLERLWVSPMTTEAAQHAAAAFHYDCQSLLEVIPELTADQAEWLDTQIDENTHDAVRSPEFCRRKLRALISQCVSAAEEAQTGISPETRILGWLVVARVLNEEGMDLLMRCSQVKNLEKENPRVFTLFANRILDNIVIPHQKRVAGPSSFSKP